MDLSFTLVAAVRRLMADTCDDYRADGYERIALPLENSTVAEVRRSGGCRRGSWFNIFSTGLKNEGRPGSED